MKALLNYFLLLAVMLLMASCTTTESNTSKDKDASKEEGLNLANEERQRKIDEWKERNTVKYGDSITAINMEDFQHFLDSISPGSYITLGEQADPETIAKYLNIDVSPNPTKSSVTVSFFSNFPDRHKLFPMHIIIDLYYLDQKVHTFDFPKSYGEETIPEQYLQKDGVYRITYENRSVPFVVRKN